MPATCRVLTPSIGSIATGFFTPGSRCYLALTCMAVAVTLVACGAKDAGPAAAGGGMPPAEVGVVTVTPGDVGLITELPGRLEASRVAQVRARAAGILQKRLFAEGRAGWPAALQD
jgi:membrane fusion protein (multidrug efflux system)